MSYDSMRPGLAAHPSDARVVMGGGPAGSTAAAQLAEKGRQKDAAGAGR